MIEIPMLPSLHRKIPTQIVWYSLWQLPIGGMRKPDSGSAGKWNGRWPNAKWNCCCCPKRENTAIISLISVLDGLLGTHCSISYYTERVGGKIPLATRLHNTQNGHLRIHTDIPKAHNLLCSQLVKCQLISSSDRERSTGESIAFKIVAHAYVMC